MNERTMIPSPDRLRAETRGAPLADTASKDPSAVSWSAVFAGAAAAAALSLILLVLGVGLGVSSVSPWSGQGISAQTFGLSTVLWLTFAQLAASGMGGYLAGRLRHRWMELHGDETYFRDTAHGFLAWAVASLVTAAVLGSAVGSIVSGGVQAGSSVVPAAAAVAGVAGAAGMADSDKGSGYFVDSLFRKNVDASPSAGANDAGSAGNAANMPASNAAGSANTAMSTSEAGRIFANAARSGALPADDAKYLGQMVAQRTGMPQADAEKRVTDGFTRMQAATQQAEVTARDAADKVRKTTAYASLWLFVALLAGAFTASLAATYGGRRRDLF